MDTLVNGHSYANMYLLFVDASGHSTVVAQNPVDVGSQAYDLLERRILERFRDSAALSRCEYHERWSWQGDGGLYMLYDRDESVALKTALDFMRRLLDIDLPALQKEFATKSIRGELHLRVAVHKGTLSYISDERRGSIHSAALNFAAHLEKATPKDCAAISGDVYKVLRSEQTQFYKVGTFEGHDVALYAPGRSNMDLARAWYAQHGFSAMPMQAMYERPSAENKAALLRTTRNEVVDLGTALHTCSEYLITTQRPAIYRDTVLELLRRGCKYRCFLLDPNGPAAEQHGRERGEDLVSKIRHSINSFQRFQKEHPAEAKHLEVYSYNHYTGFAALGIDIAEPDALLLYSPYLAPRADRVTERGDMPHYLVGATIATPVFDFHRLYIDTIRQNDSTRLL
jgi:hypothetical protein